jgi:NAD(P)-dependent dehydrogenase (short-subunit alcohol dehydrogenase family)
LSLGPASRVREEATELAPVQLVALPLDATRPKQIRAGVNRIANTEGRLDSAVSNAGDYQPMALDVFDLDLFYRLAEVNYLDVADCLAALLPLLQRRRFGQVLTNAGLASYRGLPRALPYGATRVARINLAASLRHETRDRGIFLRIFNPGFVRSSLTDGNDSHMPFLLDPEEAAQAIVRRLNDASLDISLGFALHMKILRRLPYGLYFWLTRRFER